MKERFLVDTSVWIDFFNGRDTSGRIALRKLIATGADIYLCPTILQEVLQGIKDDKDYEIVKVNLLSFTMLEMNPVEAAVKAANLYRELRKKGLTIRKSNDCLIAIHAILYDLSLLHNDSDFDLIAAKTDLKLVEL